MSNKTDNKETIVPMFKADCLRYEGEEIIGSLDSSHQDWPDNIGILAHDLDLHYRSRYIKPETIQISLDGQEWYTMDRLSKLIELGLQYEYAIEQLSPPKEAV